MKVEAATFTPRTTAPSTSDARYYSSNPFYKSGYGMPNCTCYAYGRAWEILGSKPNLPSGNAGEWWWKNKSSGAYGYGSTPKLGAIACWDRYDKDRGHVAVVEAINGNSVTLSESHYKGVNFDNKIMNANSSNYLTSMRFLGYIYIGEFQTTPPDTQAPVIKEQYSHLLDANRFRVVCTPTDNVGVTSVKAATSTDEKQTDLVWRDCVYNGAGSWFMDISFSEHHPSTAYVTHFYVYDAAGNLTTGGVGFSTSKPIISNVYITDMNTTGYTVHCIATDDYGISRVAFPTWTDKNGQDDLLWKDGQKNGSEYVFRVNTSDHKNETGTYITHVYAYDSSGNETSYGIGLTVQNDTTKPVLSNLTISDISSKGYTVKCKATDNAGLSRVQFPTWTDKNGQDDIIWGFGGKNGDTYTYRVNVSAHNNETGKYHTHIYAYDYANNYSVITITSFTPKDKYRVTFNANGGNCGTANKDVKHGGIYGTLPIPTKNHYTFTGWYTAKTGGTKITDTTKVTATSDHTLYAQWKASAHAFGNWTISKNATCTADGSKTRSCTISGCTHKETQTIAKLGHSLGNWTTSKNATCTADGSKTRSCTRNGCTYKENQTIAKLGHSMGNWTTSKNATCTADGSKTRSCTRNGCTHKETQTIAKTNHQYTSKVIAPTCTAKGYTEYICSVCKHSYKGDEKAALGHKFTSEIENGVKIYKCSACELCYKVTFEGEGTAESPYLIANKEDLFCLAGLVNNSQTTNFFRDKCYMQTANIDLENEQWIPIGKFNIDGKITYYYLGKNFVYDGGNHSIFNMKVNDSYDYCGFIGKLDGGTVKNLAVYGDVSSAGSYVGGIAGEIGYMGLAENCSFNGNVTGNQCVGGIVGKFWQGGNAKNCYSNGTVVAEKMAGGIVGFIEYNNYETELHTNINNCYHVGDISGEFAGGILGKHVKQGTLNDNNAVNIKNCYFHKASAENGLGEGTITKNDSTPLISAMIKETAVDLGSDFGSNKYEAINNGYPVFKWQLPSKVKGDINNDGEIKIADAVKAQKALSKAHITIPAEVISSDMNEDGKFNVFDIIIIKRMLLNS